MILELIGFAAVCSVLAVSAIYVVTGKNLVHSVLMLAGLLFTTAVLFVLLGAPFLAGIQVMLYAGGVVTLMLFAIMLTRRSSGVAISNETIRVRRLPAALLSGGLFALLAWAIANTNEFSNGGDMALSTRDLGTSLFTEQVLSFEVLGVLLLAATIGAIVLARKRDHGEPEPAGTVGFVRGRPEETSR
jgi:NADH:ubiquinone oxidoreductase subunit 6 (subunit J)